MPNDPSIDGYVGRNFVLPPLTHGDGRFREDIFAGKTIEEAQDWLGQEHVMTPNLPRVRRERPPQRVHTAPDGTPDWVDTDRPYRIGQGPAEASSRMTLALWPMFVHDVNFYYATLMVSPWANKAQLREAYRRIIQSSHYSQDFLVRATYVFKQLLDKDIRRAYDSMPEGSTFMDSWEAKKLRDAAKAEATRRRQQRGEDMSDIEAINEEILRVLDEEGYNFRESEEEAETPQEMLDKKLKEAQDRGWQYSFYRLRSTSYDREKLADWQSALISALAGQETILKLAVGFHRDSDHPYKVMEVGEVLVAFLRDTENPTEELARACARLLVTVRNTTPR